MTEVEQSLLRRAARRLDQAREAVSDGVRAKVIDLTNRWPCLAPKRLLVGSESSGTTAVANLLFLEMSDIRFLEEGDHHWVWSVYQEVYQGRRAVRDYPKLQLFDAIKVPGFATIIPQFRAEFPDTSVVYLVRDPRDFVASAIRTWKVQRVEDLGQVSWSKESWLSITATDPVERLATRWRTYLRCATAAGDVKFVRYEDFCADKSGTIRQLAQHMKLDFNAPRVAALANRQLSHSSVRAYQPRGPGSWHDGLLRPEHIETIETVCAAEMRTWGYEPALHGG